MQIQTLVTKEEMASILQVHPNSILRYARESLIPYYRVGRLLMFDPREVLAAFQRGPKAEVTNA